MKKLPDNHTIETVSVRITGHVQGVGFRAAAVRQAHALKVTGWVRNNSDNSVEAVLQGEHEQVDRMLSWLLMGPPAARIAAVESQEMLTERHFDRFEQI
jgi:acylphosphatase